VGPAIEFDRSYSRDALRCGVANYRASTAFACNFREYPGHLLQKIFSAEGSFLGPKTNNPRALKNIGKLWQTRP